MVPSYVFVAPSLVPFIFNIGVVFELRKKFFTVFYPGPFLYGLFFFSFCPSRWFSFPPRYDDVSQSNFQRPIAAAQRARARTRFNGSRWYRREIEIAKIKRATTTLPLRPSSAQAPPLTRHRPSLPILNYYIIYICVCVCV